MDQRHGSTFSGHRCRRRESPVPRETITSIEQIFHHYGHAGPQFVRKLVENGLHQDPENLRKRIMAMAEKLAGAEADGAKIRAAIPFAVLSPALSLRNSVFCPRKQIWLTRLNGHGNAFAGLRMHWRSIPSSRPLPISDNLPMSAGA
jgi:hypothetical protein